MVTPDVKRNAVVHVCAQHGVSQRRACEVLSLDRSSMRYRSVRPDDATIREAMKKVASERRRFGYRRIHVMLDRQGIVMNLKKLRRLYREEKLTVRKRGGRKRALGTRRPLALPSRPGERWSLDFVSDAFTDGRRFRERRIGEVERRDRQRQDRTAVSHEPTTAHRQLLLAIETSKLLQVHDHPLAVEHHVDTAIAEATTLGRHLLHRLADGRIVRPHAPISHARTIHR